MWLFPFFHLFVGFPFQPPSAKCQTPLDVKLWLSRFPMHKGSLLCCCSFVKGAAKLLAPSLDEAGLAGHDWCIKQCQEAGWDAAVHELTLVKSAGLLRDHDHQSAMGLLQVS